MNKPCIQLKQKICNEEKLESQNKIKIKLKQNKSIEIIQNPTHSLQKSAFDKDEHWITTKQQQSLIKLTIKHSQLINISKQQSQLKQQQSTPKFEQKDLFQKKRNLLKQLQKVRIEIKQLKKQKGNTKNRNNQKRSEISLAQQDNQQEKYKNVNAFIRRMKKQKEQFLIKRNKSNQQSLTKKIQQDSKIYSQLLVEQQTLKKQKRESIERKIQERKRYAQLRYKINKRSNTLVKEIINSPFHKAQVQVNRTPKVQRILRQCSEHKTCESLDIFSNPIKKPRKRYEISPFLFQVFKQQEMKKRQQQKKKNLKKKSFIKAQIIFLKNKVQNQNFYVSIFIRLMIFLRENFISFRLISIKFYLENFTYLFFQFNKLY